MSETAKILLVDDEPAMLRYIKTLLEVDDYKVETASTGEEALQRVVAEVEQLAGRPASEQRPGYADQASNDESLLSLAGDEHVGEQASAQSQNDPSDNAHG